MARKIKAGDWILTRRGYGMRFLCVYVVYDDGGVGADGRAYPRGTFTVLPASPATLAKSHRLLLRHWASFSRYCDTGERRPELMQAFAAVEAHCRRIAGKRGKK